MSFIDCKQIYQGAIILDIRTRREYRESHICGAINIPTKLPPLNLNDIDKLRIMLRETLSGIERTIPIYVYCKKGKRSLLAKVILNNLGYLNVINLGGVEDRSFNIAMNQNDCLSMCYQNV